MHEILSKHSNNNNNNNNTYSNIYRLLSKYLHVVTKQLHCTQSSTLWRLSDFLRQSQVILLYSLLISNRNIQRLHDSKLDSDFFLGEGGSTLSMLMSRTCKLGCTFFYFFSLYALLSDGDDCIRQKFSPLRIEITLDTIGKGKTNNIMEFIITQRDKKKKKGEIVGLAFYLAHAWSRNWFSPCAESDSSHHSINCVHV